MKNYKETPYLRKYCEEKYDISNKCNTLSLGTLHGYREVEDEQIRDEEEGQYNINIEFDQKRLVPNEFLNQFKKPNLKLNGNHVICTREGFISKGMTISGEFHDIWIFCLSRVDGVVPERTSKKYDAFWEFPLKNADKFCLMLRELLAKQLTEQDILENLGEPFLNNHNRKWRILCDHRKVNYGERTIKIGNNIPLNADLAFNIYMQFAFQKPKRFENEQEHRFIFSQNFFGAPVEKKKSKIIYLEDANVVLRYIGANMRAT